MLLAVCCGLAACARAPPNALRSLHDAFTLLRAPPARSVDAPAAVIDVYGTCYEPLTLTALDSHVTLRAAPVGPRAGISGAVPLFRADFVPVTDAGILSQLPPAARASVRQVDLAVAGVPLSPLSCQPYVGGNSVMTPGLLQPAGAELFAYGDPRVGGDASPLTPARYPNEGAGGPTDAWASVFGVNGTLARLELDAAAASRSALWAQQLREDPGSVRAKFIGELGWLEHTQALSAVGDAVPPHPPATCADTTVDWVVMGGDLSGTPLRQVASAGACCDLCAARTNCRFWSWQPPTTAPNALFCYLKYVNATWQRVGGGIVSGATPVARAAVPVELGAPCGTAAEDVYGDGGVVLLTNALAELDEAGEYTLNYTSGLAYVWLPGAPREWPTASPWGAPWVAPAATVGAPAPVVPPRGGDAPVAYVSAAPHAVVLDGSAFITFDGLVIEGAQDAAVVVRNSSQVVFSNCLLQNAGNMVVNVTRGSGVSLNNCTVRGGANGAALLEGGNRTTLVPGGHALSHSTLSYSSRTVWLNAPMVSVDGVGLTVEGSEVFGGPHMGLYHSGNAHRVEGNDIHEVVQACDDCGAVYGGRDWAYQGTSIAGNTLRNLHSSEGLDVSAVYLDDMISGVAVTGNVFINVSRALLLGGGRSNTFANNTIRGVSLANDAAVHFDNRGMGWSNAACNLTKSAAPNMVVLLERVPYNTSDVWRSSYPALVGILADEPCTPKYNLVVNNTYCFLDDGVPFLDATAAEIEGWGSTAGSNENATAC